MMYVLLALVWFAAAPVHAEVWGGFKSDSSSNMLMRPDGESGTFATMYAGAGIDTGPAYLFYEFGAGAGEHYEGVQAQTHDAGVSNSWGLPRGLQIGAALTGSMVRFGSVTLLDGYGESGASFSVKKYIGTSTLMRAEASAAKRWYRTQDLENNVTTDGYIRLDRFFTSGTTIRIQADAGWRVYENQPGTPSTALTGARLRVAQNISGNWGVWIQGHIRDVTADQTDYVDTSYDRVFLDDRYRYASEGIVAALKRVIPGHGYAELSALIHKKDYPGRQTSNFWYLPADGWRETENGVTFEVSYRPAFLHSDVRPFVEMYMFEVDADVDELSYRSNGVSVGIRIQ